MIATPPHTMTLVLRMRPLFSNKMLHKLSPLVSMKPTTTHQLPPSLPLAGTARMSATHFPIR